MIVEQPKKVVYMTFDDGPSENTDKILKILKKYDAKATFFVTGNNQKYNSSIKKHINKAIPLHFIHIRMIMLLYTHQQMLILKIYKNQ